MRKFVTVLSLSFLLSAVCWGQATAGLGAISGTVLDASGSPVPGAKVVVSNPSLGLTRELTTTNAGVFAAPALTPEKGYKVTVEKTGFSGYEANDLVLQVGEVSESQHQARRRQHVAEGRGHRGSALSG